MKINRLTFAVMAISIAFTACSATARETVGNSGSVVVADDGEYVVDKTLDLKDFHGINSFFNVDVRYTQGDTYKVAVRAKKIIYDQAVITVEDGILNIDIKKINGGNSTYNLTEPLTLFITSPSLDKVSNRVNMSFNAGNFSVESLDISNKGALKFNCKSISGKSSTSAVRIDNSCNMDFNPGVVKVGRIDMKNMGGLECRTDSFALNDIKFDNSGNMKFYGKVSAGSVDFRNKGGSKMTADFYVADGFEYNNYGNSVFEGNVAAKRIVMSNSGGNRMSVKLKADDAKMSVYGSSSDDIDFRGGSLYVGCNGAGSLDVTLDCKSVNVDTSGVLRMSLSGVADKVSLSGNGSSKVDTSKLNKF